MSSVTQTSAGRSSRGRRAPRANGDDRERAILETAERLLAERSLHDISVDDLARGAGISRPTFYFYFPSKDAVLLALLDRMVAEADARRDEAFSRLPEDPRARCRAAITAFYDTFGMHRAVALAAGEARFFNDEVRDLWSQVAEVWVTDLAEAIEGERAAGRAPAGLPARELAIALVQLNERVLYGTFARETPAVAEENVVDVLLAMWINAIYGEAGAAGTSPSA